jgi:hypothetical protein
VFNFSVRALSNAFCYLSAFLDEGKIAEYLPNREHFIELALKQNKKYSYENFKLSLKAAD